MHTNYCIWMFYTYTLILCDPGLVSLSRALLYCFVFAGSNGKDFMFLLKGHEDLRQDERVMQLFGLVNTLLNNDPETFKRHLR